MATIKIWLETENRQINFTQNISQTTKKAHNNLEMHRSICVMCCHRSQHFMLLTRKSHLQLIFCLVRFINDIKISSFRCDQRHLLLAFLKWLYSPFIIFVICWASIVTRIVCNHRMNASAVIEFNLMPRNANAYFLYSCWTLKKEENLKKTNFFGCLRDKITVGSGSIHIHKHN